MYLAPAAMQVHGDKLTSVAAIAGLYARVAAEADARRAVPVPGGLAICEARALALFKECVAQMAKETSGAPVARLLPRASSSPRARGGSGHQFKMTQYHVHTICEQCQEPFT